MVDYGLYTSETSSEKRKLYKKERRLKLMNLLGGAKCNKCGCNIYEILEINHINGNGNYIRKEKRLYNDHLITYILYGKNYRKRIDEKFDKKDYNVLCKVCNIHHYVETILGIKGHKITWDSVNNNSTE